MKCKNCKRSFGINFDYGVMNEPRGRCMVCEVQLCEICAYAPRIETREVIDPGEYSISAIVLCSGCVSKIGTTLANVA